MGSIGLLLASISLRTPDLKEGSKDREKRSWAVVYIPHMSTKAQDESVAKQDRQQWHNHERQGLDKHPEQASCGP